jgi:hypothetical protein
MTPNTQKRVARIHRALRNELDRAPKRLSVWAQFVLKGEGKLCASDKDCEYCDRVRVELARYENGDQLRLRKRATALVMRAMSGTWGAYVLKAGPL